MRNEGDVRNYLIHDPQSPPQGALRPEGSGVAAVATPRLCPQRRLGDASIKFFILMSKDIEPEPSWLPSLCHSL